MTQVNSLSEWEHPTSGSKRRYIVGDRFHTSSNPHKSELCAYHDINLLEQGTCIETSYQESLNHFIYFFHVIFHFISLKKENTMIILRNLQIAELIEAGCAFKSNVIISKNETKEIENK